MNTQPHAIDDTGDKPAFKIGTKCTFYGTNPHAPDQCPTCGTPLQTVDEQEFWTRIENFQIGRYEFDIFKGDGSKSPDPDWRPKMHPGYMDMWLWAKQQSHCFKHSMHLRNSYKKHTGHDVDMTM